MKGSIPFARYEPVNQKPLSQTDNAVITIHGTNQLFVTINTDQSIHIGNGTLQRITGSYIDTGSPFQAPLLETSWDWGTVLNKSTTLTLNAVNFEGIEITDTNQGETLTGNTTGPYSGGTFSAVGSFVWSQ